VPFGGYRPAVRDYLTGLRGGVVAAPISDTSILDEGRIVIPVDDGRVRLVLDRAGSYRCWKRG
jgi:hypothetical protein